MPQIAQSPYFIYKIKKWDNNKKEVVQKAVLKMADNPYQKACAQINTGVNPV